MPFSTAPYNIVPKGFPLGTYVCATSYDYTESDVTFGGTNCQSWLIKYNRYLDIYINLLHIC